MLFDTETCLHESTPKRLNPFRQSPIGNSLSDNNNFHGSKGDFSLSTTIEVQSPGEEFINCLLKSSTSSQNPFKPDGVDRKDEKQTSGEAKSVRSKYKKPVKLPNDYNGKSSLRDYLRHFNRCAVVNEWNQEESALFLSAALRGDAQKILHNMSDDDCRNYNKLVSRLRAHFGGETQQELHQARLLNRRQTEGESLRSLAADIRDTCNLAYQDLPPQSQERFCVQHFIDAINDMDDRMKLRREKTQSLDEALLSACELEAFRLLETSKRKQANMRTLSTGRENMAALTQEAQQDLEEKFEELKRQQEVQFNNLSQQIQQLLKGSNSDKEDSVSYPARNQQQPQPGRQQRQDSAECWHCKQRGHLRRDCSLWKRKQENEKRAPSNAQRSA